MKPGTIVKVKYEGHLGSDQSVMFDENFSKTNATEGY